MRVLAVCESPPTLDPRHANGSTLISHHLLARLADDHELDLVWFADRPAPPSNEVLGRALRSEELALRGLGPALGAQPLTRFPVATWRRRSRAAVATVARLAADADVAYLHGLHTFGLLDALGGTSVVAHEVDPWSLHWEQRAATRTGAAAAYDRLQAARARRREREVAERAGALVVVNPDDAVRLSAVTGRPVEALPNGIDLGGSTAPLDDPMPRQDPHRCVFAGTLDYPPNVAAVRTLVGEVWPRVRAAVPDASLVIAGRRPTAEVADVASAAAGVEVRGDVPDLGEVLRSAAVAVFPGDLGGGTRNTVAEALLAGCAVVASPASRRGIGDGPFLRVGATSEELAAGVVTWLRDPEDRADAGRAAVAFAASLPTWDGTAATFDRLLRRAAAAVGTAP